MVAAASRSRPFALGEVWPSLAPGKGVEEGTSGKSCMKTVKDWHLGRTRMAEICAPSHGGLALRARVCLVFLAPRCQEETSGGQTLEWSPL